MRFAKNSIVANLVDQHSDEKEHLIPIAGVENGYTVPMKLNFYRPIARQEGISHSLEHELSVMRYDKEIGLSPNDMPVDIWRTYYHLVDDVISYEFFEKQVVLDYAIGDYALFIRFPLDTLLMSADNAAVDKTAQLQRVAKTAQAINPVARMYYEPRPYLNHGNNYATIALSIDATAAQVADMLYGMNAVLRENITPEQVVAKLEKGRGTDEYNEFWGGMLTEYEASLYGDGDEEPKETVISYATFTDGNDKIRVKFRNNEYADEDDPSTFDDIKDVIRILGESIAYDGIKPKSLKDAVWLVMTEAAHWRWEFVEDDANIPDGAEHKAYDMAEIIHG